MLATMHIRATLVEYLNHVAPSSSHLAQLTRIAPIGSGRRSNDDKSSTFHLMMRTGCIACLPRAMHCIPLQPCIDRNIAPQSSQCERRSAKRSHVPLLVLLPHICPCAPDGAFLPDAASLH